VNVRVQSAALGQIETTPTPAPVSRSRWAAAWLPPGLALLVALLATGTTILAMRHTSPTFDEIVLVAGGARGFTNGRFDLAPEHPPLMQYVYGLPVYLSHPHYPHERTGATPRYFEYRYEYARALYFASGNDPERVAFLGRLPAALLVLTLVLLAYAFTRRRVGPWAALLAATLVAFLPDVLAHGGVAYNDLPLALAYLLAVWALDVAVRRPGVRTGLLSGAAVALAVGVKFSGGGVVVVGLVLLLLEAVVRLRDKSWRRSVAVAVVAALVGGYLTLVLIYRGDFALAEMRYGIRYTLLHVALGHGAPAYLLGRTSVEGWWYFFPVAFLLKTPVALHLLALAAVLGAVGQRTKEAGSAVLAGPLRPAWVGALVFTAFLLTAHLEIGFRYALPVLPLVCVLVAAGVARLWRRTTRVVRAALVALVLWFAASTLSFYPDFLAYTSEYGPGADHGDELLLDSSLDWGQGLLALRDWMRAEHVPRVYLGYFGSDLPAAYGIDYLPLPSYFPLALPARPPVESGDPKYVVLSATLLHPVYFPGDPFARFRKVRPYRVLAHDLYVYRLHD